VSEDQDATVYLVVAGQAAHWFNYPKLWPEMKRVVRKGGTLAFWGYKDSSDPEVTAWIQLNCLRRLSQRLPRSSVSTPRVIMSGFLSDLTGRNLADRSCKTSYEIHWDDMERIEYEPGTKEARTGEGTMLLSSRIRLGECMNYIRTWSVFNAWYDQLQKIKRGDGGEGDTLTTCLMR